jgi:hypothetical protein
MGNENMKLNKEGNVSTQISLNKVCFFPGENIIGNIKLIPKPGFFEECRKFCELVIMITQISRYTYQDGSDYEAEEETTVLMTNNFKFSDYIQLGEEKEINLKVKITLPKNARPSIFIDTHDYVKHLITVKYPHFGSKRTKVLIVKNNLNFHSKNRQLLCPFNYPINFNKKKFFMKKGSCNLVITMPRNYFLYNEKISYNIHLDCTLLDIPVYKIKISFKRTLKRNRKDNYLRQRINSTDTLTSKKYQIDKTKKLIDIVDYITFNDPLSNLSKPNSPSDIYKMMDAHGLYEVNDPFLRSLYPSCSVGLINVEYSLKAKIYFDTIFTSDEQVFWPVDFCDILDYKMPNQNDINLNNNNFNQIFNSSDIKPINNNNLINNNIINNNDIDDLNLVENEVAAPVGLNINLDGKKKFLEDNENLNLDNGLDGWVIIDKKDINS